MIGKLMSSAFSCYFVPKNGLSNTMSFVFCSIRGTLLSTLYAVENLGVLLAYIIGEYFKFYAMPLFSIILIATFAILLFFVPESAIYLVRKNKIEVSEREKRENELYTKPRR